MVSIIWHSGNLIISVITMNYLTRYIISYEDSFIVLQSMIISFILLRAFGEILFYFPDNIYYDMNCIAFA
jgi:hypothetical protein